MEMKDLTMYVAADYRRQGEARTLLESVHRELGIQPLCRWAMEGEPGEGMGGAVQDKAFALAAAKMDLEDVYQADVFVQLTTGELCRGGRQVELGFALANGKPILVVGPPEHVFHHHDTIDHVETFGEVVAWLRGYARA